MRRPWATNVDEPPPSRLTASTAPSDCMSAALSVKLRPMLYVGWRPSAVTRRRRPSAVMPASVRGLRRIPKP